MIRLNEGSNTENDGCKEEIRNIINCGKKLESMIMKASDQLEGKIRLSLGSLEDFNERSCTISMFAIIFDGPNEDTLETLAGIFGAKFHHDRSNEPNTYIAELLLRSK